MLSAMAAGAPHWPGIADSSARAGVNWVGATVWIIGGAAACVAVFGALLLLLENRLVYHPTHGPDVAWDAERLGAEEVFFRTEDGLRLCGWWHDGGTRANADPVPVLLWCHGNAGNISHRAENLQMLTDRGLAALLFDYRGYGKSEGSPSEEGLYRDARAAHRYLVEERGVEPERIVCFGRSLGAAVALSTAVSRSVAGLVMEAAFENVPAMARKLFPVVPVWGLTRNRFDNLERVEELNVPLLTIHGEKDRLVPPEQARSLFEAAPEPKEFYSVAGAGHDDTYAVGGERYLDRLELFCRRCVRGEAD